MNSMKPEGEGAGGNGTNGEEISNVILEDPEVREFVVDRIPAEKSEREMRRIQTEFSSEANAVRSHGEEIARRRMENGNAVDIRRDIARLEEKVSGLKKEHYEAAKRLGEYRDRRRARGIFSKIGKYLFQPKSATPSEELDDIMLKGRSDKSLVTYREAKRQLEEKYRELDILEGKNPDDRYASSARMDI